MIDKETFFSSLTDVAAKPDASFIESLGSKVSLIAAGSVSSNGNSNLSSSSSGGISSSGGLMAAVVASAAVAAASGLYMLNLANSSHVTATQNEPTPEQVIVEEESVLAAITEPVEYVTDQNPDPAEAVSDETISSPPAYSAPVVDQTPVVAEPAPEVVPDVEPPAPVVEPEPDPPVDPPIVLSEPPIVTPPPVPLDENYYISYWNVPGFNSQTPPSMPVTVADVTEVSADLDKDWGTGSPHIDIGSNHFIARVIQQRNLEAGEHQFSLTRDDGVRLYVGGVLLIDEWNNSAATMESVVIDQATEETVEVIVEYYEDGGNASLQLDVQYTPQTVAPTVNLSL